MALGRFIYIISASARGRSSNFEKNREKQTCPCGKLLGKNVEKSIGPKSLQELVQSRKVQALDQEFLLFREIGALTDYLCCGKGALAL